MRTIKIDLQQTEFRISQEVTGRVEWSPSEKKAQGEVRINMIYYTEGRGTRDVVIVERMTCPDTDGSADFSFNPPVSPTSFSGSLISLQWAVEVILPTSEEARSHFKITRNGDMELLREVQKTENTAKRQRGFWKRFFKPFADKS